MDYDATCTAVRKLLADMLHRPIGPDENVQFDNEPTWDSVKHTELMFMIEEKFSIHLEPEDFAHMTSLDECVKRIQTRFLNQS